MRITFKEAEERYGQIDLDSGKWPNEALWMEVFHLPKDLVFPNWLNSLSKKPVTKFYCNKDMAPSFFAALYNVRDRGFENELKTFDGLFNVRAVRGYADRLSTHCYGLAVDINAAENPLGGPIAMSEGFVKCFTDAGFTWGGAFKRVDAQHFSWGWE